MKGPKTGPGRFYTQTEGPLYTRTRFHTQSYTQSVGPRRCFLHTAVTHKRFYTTDAFANRTYFA